MIPDEPNVSVRLAERGACIIVHGRSKTQLIASTYLLDDRMALPSDADLVAAALGAGVASSIEELVERAEFEREDLAVHVRITHKPRSSRLTEIFVHIALPRAPSSELRVNLERAAALCIARRAIDPRVKVLFDVVTPDQPVS